MIGFDADVELAGAGFATVTSLSRDDSVAARDFHSSAAGNRDGATHAQAGPRDIQDGDYVNGAPDVPEPENTGYLDSESSIRTQVDTRGRTMEADATQSRGRSNHKVTSCKGNTRQSCRAGRSRSRRPAKRPPETACRPLLLAFAVGFGGSTYGCKGSSGADCKYMILKDVFRSALSVNRYSAQDFCAISPKFKPDRGFCRSPRCSRGTGLRPLFGSPHRRCISSDCPPCNFRIRST